jgi:hypothetical protein
MLPALLAILLSPTLRASDGSVPGSSVPDGSVSETTASAALAFARYTTGLLQASPWDVETIDIDASLPSQKKTGRLRAIRRLLPFGKPEYQVLQSDGDKTVKQQVIVRYLSADVQAAQIPSADTAITTANYKFHYKGTAKLGDATAYVFQISPRHKREGLIKGELWLDAETGTAIRQTGYFVKKPSIFVKRMEVTRDVKLEAGRAQLRVTHLSVDVRIFGRAELTIEEQPYTDLRP